MPMEMREKFKGFLDELATAVKRCYGERLVTLVVYGSVGRGTPRPDSDVDLLVVARALPQGRIRRVEEFAVVEAELEPALLRLKREGIETYLSPVIKSPEEVQQGSLLFLDMLEDAIFLCDEGDFFRNFLEGFRQRLEKLGARRVWRGDVWHWVLKDPYEPGEVFEI